ncbi:helix-turn-helix transcriptional regulator [Bacillus sp. V33-4]|uniref:helix-turn-helix transcriptional regulator n=1 Tax=Bacillus sp. V33-4 TaxID=2054169 RepID=UPI000C76645A|nr:helix-turn-helix transcriptional regulator [Bacillus sp. V33-4]PLR87097.1 transcriptional regulator [Bacillus sp. V33-4]
MEYGPLIKFYRTQKKLTLKDLAAGICSVSHLSKIEHNSKDANIETIMLLLNRLNISLAEISEQEQLIGFLLNELKDKIDFYLKDEAQQLFEQLSDLENIIPFSSYLYKYELIKYRYQLFQRFLVEAEQQRDMLKKQTRNFSQNENYLYQSYNALFLILKGQFKKADEAFDQLLTDKNSESATGELIYHRALVKSSLKQSSFAIHYGKHALQLFMNQHNFKRILHSLMLLGINYTNSKIYDEALSCFKHLIRNAEMLNDQHLLSQIYHNMGFLQWKMGNLEQALKYYNKSLALQSKQSSQYLITLYSVGEIYYSLLDMEQAHLTFDELSQLSAQLSIKKYQILARYYLTAIDSKEKSIEYLETKVIPYLEQNSEYMDDVSHFYHLLSLHYREIGMHKKAVKYLEKTS